MFYTFFDISNNKRNTEANRLQSKNNFLSIENQSMKLRFVCTTKLYSNKLLFFHCIYSIVQSRLNCIFSSNFFKANLMMKSVRTYYLLFPVAILFLETSKNSKGKREITLYITIWFTNISIYLFKMFHYKSNIFVLLYFIMN